MLSNPLTSINLNLFHLGSSIRFFNSVSKIQKEMRSNLSLLLVAALGLNSAIADSHVNLAPLKNEHPGQIFKPSPSSTCCVDGVVNTGNSTGKFTDINGSKFPLHPQIP